MKETALLYSGGTDSTCAAALAAGDFDRVHLLTFSRFGVFSISHSEVNVKKLREKFGEDKFVHRIINVDKLFKEVSYSNYLDNLRRHGFFLLTTCGLCKLAMHFRCLVYCLENDIKSVSDGANKNMDYAPDQIRELIEELRKMYSRRGIEYTSPVYEMAHPDDIEWFDKLGVGRLSGPGEKKESGCVTTGEKLYQMGIFPEKNMKGTPDDRKMQARCFQLVLANIFANWLYLPGNKLEDFKKECVSLYREKIVRFDRMVDEYKERKIKSRLFRLIA